jgi:hypothetical protein
MGREELEQLRRKKQTVLMRTDTGQKFTLDCSHIETIIPLPR